MQSPKTTKLLFIKSFRNIFDRHYSSTCVSLASHLASQHFSLRILSDNGNEGKHCKLDGVFGENEIAL